LSTFRLLDQKWPLSIPGSTGEHWMAATGSKRTINISCPIAKRNRTMRFNIYGRFQVEVRREDDSWMVYRSELGKRILLNDVIVPRDLGVDDLVTYLDDIFHEFARLGENVEVMAD
jgi:hypothetical protein